MHEYGMPVTQTDAETAAKAAHVSGDAPCARNIAILAGLYMPAIGPYLEGLISSSPVAAA